MIISTVQQLLFLFTQMLELFTAAETKKQHENCVVYRV